MHVRTIKADVRQRFRYVHDSSVVSPTIGVERLTAVTQWAQATGSRLFLAEFGSGSDVARLTATQNMLNYMSQNTNVWQGATAWGGGPWWGITASGRTRRTVSRQIDLLKTCAQSLTGTN